MGHLFMCRKIVDIPNRSRKFDHVKVKVLTFSFKLGHFIILQTYDVQIAYLTQELVANVYSVPMPGMGLGPGIPSFLKTPNCEVAFLKFIGTLNLKYV